jgi:hypothetical protein
MATTRPFAYNPSQSPISGTTQFGDIAIGVDPLDYSLSPGGLEWWNGPDEDLGYVIAIPVPSDTQPTNIPGVSASIGFFRTGNLTDESFIEMANYIAGQTFINVTDAKTYLDSNGYWTSWVQSYSAGLFKTTYSGYFNDNVSFFATATPASVGGNPATSVQTTSIFEPAQDDGSNFSCQWLGYFKPTTSETYTFFTSSDDASYVWIGSNAQVGFTTGNTTVNNGGLHGMQEQSGSTVLIAGVYYPIRIQFGELNGGDAMTFNYSTPTITKTTNVTGLVFYNTTTNGF